MKILKNPIIAILLTVIIVIGSTLISVNSDLSGEAKSVAKSFYKAPKNQISQADNMLNLCEIGDKYCELAAQSGTDSSAVAYAVSVLRGDIEKKNLDMDTVCVHYAALKEEIEVLDMSLFELMPDRVSALRNEHAPVAAAIDNSYYNDNAVNFRHKLLKFPAKQFAALLGIQSPPIFF